MGFVCVCVSSDPLLNNCLLTEKVSYLGNKTIHYVTFVINEKWLTHKKDLLV